MYDDLMTDFADEFDPFVDDFEDEFDDLEEDFEDDEGVFDFEDIAEMEELAEYAIDSLEDEEAEDAFLGALASIASRVLPVARKAMPLLMRAGRAALNRIRRSPAARSAVRTIPTIMRKTAADQLRRYSKGRSVTARSTLRSAARHTSNVLRNPQRRRAILQRQRRIVRSRQTGRSPHAPTGMRRPSRVPKYRRVCRCQWVRA